MAQISQLGKSSANHVGIRRARGQPPTGASRTPSRGAQAGCREMRDAATLVRGAEVLRGQARLSVQTTGIEVPSVRVRDAQTSSVRARSVQNRGVLAWGVQ